ncbi:leucine-rich repeat domain-containing protein [Mycoplasma sp. P36-A1]|uniref:leucine-rich repeat domain-containing protein n=1 Tax=Mycoplasma sp. P36-A1 TaxID=3252900 RepID=UPI003C2B7B7C
MKGKKVIKKKVLTIALTAIALLNVKSINAATFKATFPTNENFASCVAKNLEKDLSDEVKNSEIENLKILNCSSASITNIADITKLPALEEVNFSNNNIKNVGAMGYLNKLHTINLTNNRNINNLNSLYYVSSLTNLNVRGTRDENLNILSEFTNLEALDISNNKLDNLDFILRLSKLKELNISDNDLTTISSLTNFTKLVVLEADNNKLVKINNLPKNIINLNLASNKITTVLNLKDFQKLSYLDLANNQLKNIDFLTDQSNIRYLDISNNNITSAVPLNTMNNLQVLTLDYNKIKDSNELNTKVRELYDRNAQTQPESSENSDGDKTVSESESHWYNILLENKIPLAIVVSLIVIAIIFSAVRKKKNSKYEMYESDIEPSVQPEENTETKKINFDDENEKSKYEKELEDRVNANSLENIENNNIITSTKPVDTQEEKSDASVDDLPLVMDKKMSEDYADGAFSHPALTIIKPLKVKEEETQIEELENTNFDIKTVVEEIKKIKKEEKNNESKSDDKELADTSEHLMSNINNKLEENEKAAQTKNTTSYEDNDLGKLLEGLDSKNKE